MPKLVRPLKFIAGLLLLPTALFVFLGFADILWALVKSWRITLWFLLGAALYLLLHKFVYGFGRLYVLAHEAAHAAAALISGHRVQSMTVNGDSGNVKVSGVNTFILLAPYVFPLFAFAAVFAYFIISFFDATADRRTFVFLFGFFTAHHFAHTYKSLTETEQSDIKTAGGNLFSFALIAALNLCVMLLLLEMFFPGVVPAWGIIKKVLVNTRDFWVFAGKFIIRAFGK
ncbi:MAG: M50 family metallopeptidase [Elusimicrobiota bacterium]|jgi:hypothetical protein|nr:M50 family metallopeptidase [Elusimicrobiota bacterium]